MKTNKLNYTLIRCATIIGSSAVMSTLADEANQSLPQDKTYAGVISSVSQPEHTLGIKGWLLTKHFNLGQACAITLPDKTAGTTSDLRPGENVVVHYQNINGVLIADGVEQKPMRMEGRVAKIDPDKHMLTLHQTGLDKDMVIGDNCRIVLRGGVPGTFSSVQPGDLVTVTYETPEKSVVAHEIDQTSINYVGNVTAIDLGERTVKAKTFLDTKSFNLASDCAIIVNGKSDAKLADLHPNQRLVFSYDEINGVNVVNRIATADSQKNASTAQGNNNNSTNNEVGFAPPMSY